MSDSPNLRLESMRFLFHELCLMAAMLDTVARGCPAVLAEVAEQIMFCADSLVMNTQMYRMLLEEFDGFRCNLRKVPAAAMIRNNCKEFLRMLSTSGMHFKFESDLDEDVLVECDRGRVRWMIGDILHYVTCHGIRGTDVHCHALRTDGCVEFKVEASCAIPHQSGRYHENEQNPLAVVRPIFGSRKAELPLARLFANAHRGRVDFVFERTQGSRNVRATIRFLASPSDGSLG